MRVAIPLWQGRVSPVFDEASRLLLVEISNGREKCRHEEFLTVESPFERAFVVRRLRVDLLICGMISQSLHTALASAGIRIIPHICGPMEDVIAAFFDGRLESGAMTMPGCGTHKHLQNRGGKASRKQL
jgi:predicted Fe-Mo cluster-binding NifX family protein